MPTKKAVIARFNVAKGMHTVELVETPKGMVQATIDGDVMSQSETREIAQWLRMITGDSKSELPD